MFFAVCHLKNPKVLIDLGKKHIKLLVKNRLSGRECKVGWYMNNISKVLMFPYRRIRARSGSTAQHSSSGTERCDSNQLQQPHEHRVAGCCCSGAGLLLLGGRVAALCSPHGVICLFVL